MASAGAIMGMTKGRQSGQKGIRQRTSSNEELSERRSSIRRSLESGLDDEEDELEGPVKTKFMPFFRKFWPHLDNKEEGVSKRYTDSSLGDELVGDEPTDSLKSINPSWFGKPVEEVDPFIFEDVSLIIYCLFCFLFSLHNQYTSVQAQFTATKY
jgi:hypothetical protein